MRLVIWRIMLRNGKQNRTENFQTKAKKLSANQFPTRRKFLQQQQRYHKCSNTPDWPYLSIFNSLKTQSDISTLNSIQNINATSVTEDSYSNILAHWRAIPWSAKSLKPQLFHSNYSIKSESIRVGKRVFPRPSYIQPSWNWTPVMHPSRGLFSHKHPWPCCKTVGWASPPTPSSRLRGQPSHDKILMFPSLILIFILTHHSK